MKKLKNNTFVGNTGHFDNEVDLAGSEGFEGTEVDHIKPQKIVLVSPVGQSVIMMRLLKGFFALFPDFEKVRSSTASAEMTRQVEISTLSAHQMAHGGVVAHTSSWTPAAYELEESSPPLDSHTGGLPELPDGRREQGDKVVCILMGLTAGNAAGYRGGAEILESRTSSYCQRSLLSPFSLVPRFVTDSRMFWVFGSLFQRRCGAPLACCCGSGNVHLLRRLRPLFRQLLRQRPSTSQWDRNINWAITFVDASWRATPLVVAGLSRADRGHHVPALTVTRGGRGVGSDEACSDKSSRGREQHNYLRNRKRGRCGLQKCFTVGPHSLSGPCFRGAVPVACLWLSLWVWACSLLGRCLSPLVLPFWWGPTQKEKGTDPKTGSGPKVTF